MKILLITATRIGDAVLSTGILRHIRETYPEARVTVACGALSASLFEGNKQVQAVIPMTKARYHGHWVKLWQQVVKTRWDVVIDLRNSAVSRLIFAKKRYGFGAHIDSSLHKVQQNAAVLKLSGDVPAPMLEFTDSQLDKAKALIGDTTHSPVIGIGPAANWTGKTWPVTRFIEVTQWLIEKGGFFEGARVAVFGAPGEEAVCNTLLDALPHDQRIDLVAKGNPGEAAAMLSLCDFYLGNDSGLMHAAAAANVPCFGLFGASYPDIYRPWGDHCDYARTPETFDELIDYEGYSPATAPCLMGSLTVQTVKEKLALFLSHV